jgi:restriction endonuclease S subunit
VRDDEASLDPAAVAVIRIPDLPEQRRIAGSLDAYAALAAKARSVADGTDELLAGIRETLISTRG